MAGQTQLCNPGATKPQVLKPPLASIALQYGAPPEDDLLKPFVNALDANVVVKVPVPETTVQTTVVDHLTRMAAASHLIWLCQAKRNEVVGQFEFSHATTWRCRNCFLYLGSMGQ